MRCVIGENGGHERERFVASVALSVGLLALGSRCLWFSCRERDREGGGERDVDCVRGLGTCLDACEVFRDQIWPYGSGWTGWMSCRSARNRRVSERSLLVYLSDPVLPIRRTLNTDAPLVYMGRREGRE